MKLTDSFIKNLKTPLTQEIYSDGEGLNLRHSPNGQKTWLYRYRRPVSSSHNSISFGIYPRVTLKDARTERIVARGLLDKGIDPSVERQDKRQLNVLNASNSFKAVASLWFDNWKLDKAPSTVSKTIKRLELDIYPTLGDRPIAEITARQILLAIKKIEGRDAVDLAERAFQRCCQIFRYAIANGICERSPVSDVQPADFLKPKQTKNHARVDEEDLPGLLQKIDLYKGSELTRLAMLLMNHVFLRTDELIDGRWSEINFEKKQWRVPATRMKMPFPHIIGLSRQAITILGRLKEITGGREFIFPSRTTKNKSMSNNTILYALYRMGYKGIMTGHGFRGVASTILHELDFAHEHIEMQLAHKTRNKTSGSYNYAKYLPQRATMLQAWSDYIDRVKLEVSLKI